MNRFILRQLVIGVLCGLLGGCGPPQVNRAEPQDAKVYAAFFAESARPQAETLFVAESTLVLDALGAREPDPEHSQMLGLLKREGISTELASSLSQASAQKRLTRGLRLPAPAHVLSAVELKGISPADPREYWNEFYRRYPRARGYQAFSPIGYSTSGWEALFYHEYYCGGLCGAGNVVWVARDSNGHWKVRKTINLWIA
jgi:hypothetical protein